ncbi:MAG: RluA family pseudouridine synthase [Candidatus Omnitrophica bacterium]|nr:RluA family pseudouridine synthase [Candidatus Omnitrophota bacterium]
MNIPIAYEDDWLLIVDKPAGLLTIPTPKNEQYTLTSILNGDLKKRGVSYRLHPCHRLDRETSGLIIYAKGKSVQKRMMELFKQKEVKKSYLAIVQGNLKPSRGQIRTAIEGREAITKYDVVENRKDFSVVEVVALTGRTNQIRIHFKSIAHPLVGEAKFAFRKDYKLKAKRACLHAKYLEFTHPVTGKAVSVNSELAKDLKEFLKAHND